jgi:hypothetical protein
VVLLLCFISIHLFQQVGYRPTKVINLSVHDKFEYIEPKGEANVLGKLASKIEGAFSGIIKNRKTAVVQESQEPTSAQVVKNKKPYACPWAKVAADQKAADAKKKQEEEEAE